MGFLLPNRSLLLDHEVDRNKGVTRIGVPHFLESIPVADARSGCCP